MHDTPLQNLFTLHLTFNSSRVKGLIQIHRDGYRQSVDEN